MTPQQTARYPAPDRSNFTPNKHVDDEALPEGDLGACAGVLQDGRPYLQESWFQEGISLITLFFSVLDLESAPAADLLRLVAPVLAEARVPDEMRRLGDADIRRINDAKENSMFSLTFVVGLPED
jgi:hypothetical protein